MIYRTERGIENDTDKIIAHLFAHLPVFDPAYPPEPTTNKHFMVTRDQVAPWYADNFMTEIESNRIRIVATQTGFMIELIPEKRKQ